MQIFKLPTDIRDHFNKFISSVALLSYMINFVYNGHFLLCNFSTKKKNATFAGILFHNYHSSYAMYVTANVLGLN